MAISSNSLCSGFGGHSPRKKILSPKDDISSFSQLETIQLKICLMPKLESRDMVVHGWVNIEWGINV